VIEKMPHVRASRQACPKMSVSSPGIDAAVAYISAESYMIPCVEYSGNTTRSIPGRPLFIPTTISAIL